tara:strand:+ start:3339 stop:4268 length:930 start_codon:yes stop_codon:yes gene_type:complete
MPRLDQQTTRGIALIKLLLIIGALLLVSGVGYLLLGENLLDSISPSQQKTPASAQTTTDSATPALPPSPDLTQLAAVVSSLAGSKPSAATALRPEPVVNKQPIKLALIPAQSLPDLDNSDSLFRAALSQLDPTQQLIGWLIDEEMIRKLVVTIDNMAEGRVPRKHSLLRPLKDRFRASEKGDQIWLDGYNYSRYNPYVELLSSLDSQDLVDLYRRYYPQMQQAYAELGYPGKRFHDRVLLALEHLQQSPVFSRALALAQPSVMYTFADPELEQLSPVHKQMLRLGPVNARRVLDVVSVLRAELLQLQHE